MTMNRTDEPDLRPGRLVRCRSLGLSGRIDRVFLDADGEIAAVAMEADGGGWIAARLHDLVTLRKQDLN